MNSQCIVAKMYAKDHVNMKEEKIGIFGKKKKKVSFPGKWKLGKMLKGG